MPLSIKQCHTGEKCRVPEAGHRFMRGLGRQAVFPRNPLVGDKNRPRQPRNRFAGVALIEKHLADSVKCRYDAAVKILCRRYAWCSWSSAKQPSPPGQLFQVLPIPNGLSAERPISPSFYIHHNLPPIIRLLSGPERRRDCVLKRFAPGNTKPSISHVKGCRRPHQADSEDRPKCLQFQR